MGSGKSAVSKALAKLLRLKVLDCDDQIVKKTGVEIAYIFEKEGEQGFRQRETDLLLELRGAQNVVIATGGGVVLKAENRFCLREIGFVVYLRTSVDEQVRRTASSKKRPLLVGVDPRKKLAELMAIRAPLYEQIADFIIDTDHSKVSLVAQAVQKAYLAQL
jgi:shikimate kinase